MPETDELSARYRPRRVRVLLVGESSPADAHFYLANGNLFRATQTAFAAGLGSEAVPSGEPFLKFFAAKGCWLIDLVDRPLGGLTATDRRAAVEQGITRLAEMLAETKPKHVVVIKADVAAHVERAIELSGVGVKTPSVLVLRYPLRQWRAEYVARLAELVNEL